MSSCDEFESDSIRKFEANGFEASSSIFLPPVSVENSRVYSYSEDLTGRQQSVQVIKPKEKNTSKPFNQRSRTLINFNQR